MATPMISKQWPRFVLPIVRREWYQKMAAIKSPLAPFFGTDVSTSPVEYSQGIGSLGLVPEYNSDEAEGGPASIQYDSFSPLYETTFTHKEYALGIEIERKLIDDERNGQIKRKAAGLGMSFGTTIATHMSSILNNAFSDDYLGGDGEPLVEDDHPVNKDDADTYDNQGTSQLSYDSMVATLKAGRDMNDDRENPLPVIYDTVYVPTALESTAFEIVKAYNKPGTADNDANFIKSKNLQVVVDPYLTDDDNWFMISTPLAKLHLLWFWRVKPEIAMDPTSDYNLAARYRGYMRYSFGWDDARWIYGHAVS